MSAVWLKLITIVCLSCTALSGPEKSEVVWRDVGGTITIQCRSEPNREHLALRRGIREEVQIFHKAGITEKNEIAPEFKDRLQLNGAFPNMDFLIKNLTSDDTGPYWCEYSKFDEKSTKIMMEKGNGSVLLVVRGADKAQQCEPSTNNQVLMFIVITAAVLFTIIMSCLIWIILKTRTCSNTTAKPRSVATNDVYEDMRGTLRR